MSATITPLPQRHPRAGKRRSTGPGVVVPFPMAPSATKAPEPKRVNLKSAANRDANRGTTIDAYLALAAANRFRVDVIYELPTKSARALGARELRALVMNGRVARIW